MAGKGKSRPMFGGKLPIDLATDEEQVLNYNRLNGRIYELSRNPPFHGDWEKDTVEVVPAPPGYRSDTPEPGQSRGSPSALSTSTLNRIRVPSASRASNDDDEEEEDYQDDSDNNDDEEMVNEDYDQIEPEDEDEANVDSTYTPNAARNYNATRNYNAAPKSSNAYSQKEFIQIFDWVQARMREVRRRLNMADFDIIATWRNDEFVGKWVEEGEELANGSLAPFTYAYPARNGKSLHSFCTKKSPKGDSYDLLLTNWTRIWARGDAMAANADEGEGGEEEADNDDDYTDEGEAEGVDDDEMDDEADGDDV